MSMDGNAHRLVRLANGDYTLHATAYAEKMHPGLGPEAEADLLYVQQLGLPQRAAASEEEFVLWDVGLGAAANALAGLRATRSCSRPLRLISFDDTLEPLRFALQHPEALGYLRDYEAPLARLIENRQLRFTDGQHEVAWQLQMGDFPSLLASRTAPALPSPHAIMFDAFSPAHNPAMWTLPLFTNLFQALDPERPCNLTTYSRSTMVRVTLLLAGFFVGRGGATGMKEETTVAANTLELIDAPLDHRWLERARRSDCAEPLYESAYSRTALSTESWEKLQLHRQFNP
ncbi:MAG: MnmC family methyltransferase [Verrucomicrobiae bacterium]|nr:MnmC family methyltransferase [Verrucomicrobiae bacterium]